MELRRMGRGEMILVALAAQLVCCGYQLYLLHRMRVEQQHVQEIRNQVEEEIERAEELLKKMTPNQPPKPLGDKDSKLRGPDSRP